MRINRAQVCASGGEVFYKIVSLIRDGMKKGGAIPNIPCL